MLWTNANKSNEKLYQGSYISVLNLSWVNALILSSWEMEATDFKFPLSIISLRKISHTGDSNPNV